MPEQWGLLVCYSRRFQQKIYNNLVLQNIFRARKTLALLTGLKNINNTLPIHYHLYSHTFSALWSIFYTPSSNSTVIWSFEQLKETFLVQLRDHSFVLLTVSVYIVSLLTLRRCSFVLSSLHAMSQYQGYSITTL